MSLSYNASTKQIEVEDPTIYLGATYFVAVLGVAGNLFSVWVWLADKKFHALTFLFKYLAVVDSFYLVTFLFTLDFYFGYKIYFTADNKGYVKVIYTIASFFQLLSIHTATLISLTRWKGVYRAQEAKELLSPGPIYRTCAFIFAWSFMLANLELFMGHFKYNIEYVTVKCSLSTVGHVLPTLVMAFFGISLFYNYSQPMETKKVQRGKKVSQARSHISVGTPIRILSLPLFRPSVSGSKQSRENSEVFVSNESSRPSVTPVADPDQCGPVSSLKSASKRDVEQRPSVMTFAFRTYIPSLTPIQTFKPRDNKKELQEGMERVKQRRLTFELRREVTLTVALLSLSAFLVYPVGWTIVYIVYGTCGYGLTLVHLTLGVYWFQMANSSIKAVLFVFIMKHFKRLLIVRMKKHCSRSAAFQDNSAKTGTSSFEVTGNPQETRASVSTQYRRKRESAEFTEFPVCRVLSSLTLNIRSIQSRKISRRRKVNVHKEAQSD